MKRIAEFYKVSYERFKQDYLLLNKDSQLSDDQIKAMYDGIKLPRRATNGSAGYDFFLPYDLSLKPGQRTMVPTGVRFWCKQDWALLLLSKSGLGSKYRLQFDTCVSLIDSDYYYGDNEGHIWIPLIYDFREKDQELNLPAGKGFVQGMFVRFGITKSDKINSKRNGGFGSTKV